MAQNIKVCLGTILFLSLAFPSFVFSQARPLKKIHVGVPSVSVANIIIYVTKEAKLYEKYGLDAQVIAINGSGIASKALYA